MPDKILTDSSGKRYLLRGQGGCGMWGALGVIAVVIFLLSFICSYVESCSNKLRYGIWDSSAHIQADLDATATAAEQAKRYNEVGSMSDPSFFTKLAQHAHLSVGNPTNLGFQDDSFYFTISIKNDDTTSHSAGIRYSFDFSYLDIYSQEPHQAHLTFDDMGNDLVIPPKGELTRKETPSPVNATITQGNTDFGIRLDSVQSIDNFQSQIIMVDSLPAVDPRQVLSNMPVSVSADQPALVPSPDVDGESSLECRIGVSNNDESSHTITLSGALQFAYTDMGDQKQGTNTVNIANKVTIPPHTTYHNFENYSGIDPTADHVISIHLVTANTDAAPPERTQSASLQLSMTLLDPGDENTDAAQYATLQITPACSYQK